MLCRDLLSSGVAVKIKGKNKLKGEKRYRGGGQEKNVQQENRRETAE